MKHHRFTRLWAALLVVALLVSLTGTALAAPSGKAASEKLTIEKRESISANLLRGAKAQEPETKSLHADTDVVRVIISLEQPSLLRQMKAEGRSTRDLTGSSSAMAYQAKLLTAQNDLAAAISRSALGGKKLDVVWNLTVVTNAMSANVPYGKLDAIRAVPGVAGVTLAMTYQPMEASVSNTVAKEMTGVTAVQSNAELGYTGAGMRIAVLDTGTDTDHQSFDNDSFLYALYDTAAKNGEDYKAYVESLDLLDEAEISQVLTKLHAYQYYGNGHELRTEDLYYTEKLPFNFNYIDRDLDVTHDNDTKGEHGSHVAGIAAANRFIPLADDLAYDLTGDGQVDRADAEALMEYVVSGTAYANQDATADVDGDESVTTHDVTALLSGKKTAAVDRVGVEGVAPDAQIVTMKVFGKNGGANDDDICAAIEDAILLGCDAINLSLGASFPGYSEFYYENTPEIAEFMEKVMAEIKDTDAIVAIAAGNNGNWADYDNAYQLMYTDEGGTANTSNPATYTNALSVASADNVGNITDLQSVFSGGEGTQTVTLHPQDGVVYDADMHDVTEHFWGDLVGQSFDAVFLGDPTKLLTGTGAEDNAVYAGQMTDFDANGDYSKFAGKVVLVARGSVDADGDGEISEEEAVNFSTKHSNAAAAGAAAILVYNNVPGEGAPGMNLQGTTGAIPCGGITYEEAAALLALAGEKNADGLFALTLEVKDELVIDHGPEDAQVRMSDFSSWGSTGALTIKPEVTAPGGNIYSVNGKDPSGTAYELMSGTSMATPHVSGFSALAIEYIERAGLEAKTGLSRRVLAQSLMMSTAEPLMEYTIPGGEQVEYSVRNQGAGLVDLEALVNAETYVMVDGQPDGKVKAELGDGAGARTFTFQVKNLTAEPQSYRFDSSILTTGTQEETLENGHTIYLATDRMVPADATVTYTCDAIDDATGTFTVPASGSVSVTVTIEVDEDFVNAQKAKGYTNGFYLEGYIYLVAAGDTQVTHSIPLLGWYGDWADPSMYDKGDYTDYFHRFVMADTGEVEDGRPVYELDIDWPDQKSHLDYLTANALTSSYIWLENVFSICPVGDDQGYYYSGNPYNDFANHESEYIPARSALNGTADRPWEFYAIFPSVIRNASAMRIRAYDPDSKEVYKEYKIEDAGILGSFYIPEAQGWQDMTSYQGFGFDEQDPWNYTDSHGETLAEGRKVAIELTLAPEYYRSKDAEGNVTYDWDAVAQGKGTTLSWTFTLDNTAPELSGDRDQALTIAQQTVEGETHDVLTYKVRDNRYVAAVVLLDGAGNSPLVYNFPNQTTEGTEVTGTIDLTAEGVTQKKITIAVCDYAGNETYYTVNRGGENASYGSLWGFQADIMDGVYHKWVALDPDVDQNETSLFASTGVEFACAEVVNGWIFAQTADGNLYAIPAADFVSDKRFPDSIHLAKLDNIYQDLAYNYSTGALYGLNTLEDRDGYPTSEVFAINFDEEVGDDWPHDWPDGAFDETWVMSQGGVWGLTLAVDDAGSFYMLGEQYVEPAEEETVALTAAEGEGSDAPTDPETPAEPETPEKEPQQPISLWKSSLEENDWGWMEYSPLRIVAQTDVIANYRQSMTFDHNTEKLYWASFNAPSLFVEDAYLYELTLPAPAVTPDEGGEGTASLTAAETTPGETTTPDTPATPETPAADPEDPQIVVGEDGVGEGYGIVKRGKLSSETFALMAPLTDEAAIASHANVPAFDGSIAGRPALSEASLTLLPGGTHQLTYKLDPWYTDFTEMTWTSSDPTVCTVSQSGVVTGVGRGAATITVASKEDDTLTDTCEVTVAAVDAELHGFVSANQLYDYTVEGGVAEMTLGNRLQEPETDWQGEPWVFGGSAYSSVMGRDGKLYTGDCDDTGVLYRVDPDTGVIEDWFQPIDGDFMYSLAYSNATDTFTGVMNRFLYVDVPLEGEREAVEFTDVDENGEEYTFTDYLRPYEKEMLDSYDDAAKAMTWHRLDFEEYLNESNEKYNFVTGETGNGATTEIVFAAVTAVDNTQHTTYEYVTPCLGGGMGMSGPELTYTPDTTLVLMDNVGRFWYVDEVTGMTLSADEWGNTNYVKGEGEDATMLSPEFHGLEAVRTGTNAEGEALYSVFILRAIEETALFDLYQGGGLPRITYHYNDLHHTTVEATKTATVWDEATEQNVTTTETIQRDVYFLSLNQSFWVDGDYTNYLYAYIPGVPTGQTGYDENWNVIQLKTPDLLLDLGTTGEGCFMATIHDAALLGGVDLDVTIEPSEEGGWYMLDPSATLSDAYQRS